VRAGRALAVITAAIAALAAIEPGAQEAPHEATVLERASVVERPISNGQTHRYRLALAAGEYVRVTVEQRGIDVVVQLLGADDRPILIQQGELRPQGTEQIELVAKDAGAQTVLVEPARNGSTPGSYAIRIAAARPATANDHAILDMRTLRTSYLQLHRAGNLDGSQPPIERALAIGERVLGRDDPEVALIVSDLAGISLDRRDYATAEPLYVRALSVLESRLGADHPETAYVVMQLGVVYHRTGRRPGAEKLLQRALDASERALGPEHRLVAQCLLNLGVLRDDAGDREKAQELAVRALAIAERADGPDSPMVATLLNNLGLISLNTRDFGRARDLFERALRIAETRDGQDSYSASIYLQNLGIIERELKNYAKAEEYYSRVLAFRERVVGPDHPDVAAICTNLANIYRLKGDVRRALEMHFRALGISEKTGPYDRGVLLALGNIARTYAAAGDTANAITFQNRVDEAIETQLSLNLAIGSERQKLAYSRTVADRTDRTISLDLETAPGKGDARTRAAVVLMQRKGRVLDAMTDTFGILRQHTTDARDQHLLDELKQATVQLAQLALNGPGGMSLDDYRKTLEQAEERKEKLEAAISERSAEFRALSQTVSLPAVQAAIPADAALVEIAVYRPFNPKAESNSEAYGDPRYAAYVIGRATPPRGTDLGPAKAIDDAVDALRHALRDPSRTDVDTLARIVDAKVLQPVRALLSGEKRLLISPDGALNLIPFEALVDEQQQFAVERYSISYLTSGRDLLRLQVPRTSRGEAVVVADPDFGEPAVGTTERPAPRPAAQRRSVTTASDLTSMYFAPLAGTALEARAIRTLLPQTRVLSRDQATKAALLDVNAPRILHVATHGFFLADATNATENPLLRSGLALAGANLGRTSNSGGLFTALEASTVNLWGTKLVTLSACDTGLGEVRNGEGVYGLRRAFFLAGAETLVMSLWPVSDSVTREMMTAYYTGLTQGLGRGEALRQAQLAMRSRPDRRHPFHWAGFIQAGEWANLDGQRQEPRPSRNLK
jgi:CHAT domain-containing protein